MSNGLSASFSGSIAVSVPTYVADGMTGTGGTRTLTFSAGAPPTDGSIGLAFIQLDPSLGQMWQNGGTQRLAYFRGANVNTATITPNPPDGSSLAAKVPSYAFVPE